MKPSPRAATRRRAAAQPAPAKPARRAGAPRAGPARKPKAAVLPPPAAQQGAKPHQPRTPLLDAVGHAVREKREHAGRSRRDLAERSGLSERFLADLEAGQGNISVERLSQLCTALGTTAGALLSEAERALGHAPTAQSPLWQLLAGLSPDERREAETWLRARFGQGRGQGPSQIVALLGLRGAGKSTIGRQLAERLAVPFVELDELVERAAGLSLSGIFSLHGEAYYRRLAREVLARVLAEGDAAVIATGGSMVTDKDALRLLSKRCTTVWLKATPEDHWLRVLAQGDERPGAASENAQAELRALLAARAPLYAQAQVHVDTSRLGLEGAVEAVLREVRPGK
jgi:XRE family aerobic/anaerobic benzoate catabolism transcriptional regulator